MKAVFVGGGSLRLLGILRGALAEPRIFHDGEINLYDLNATRAEAMARMIMRTPEYAKVRCKVTWGTTLAEALDGADMVGVILMAGSDETFQAGGEACYRHGFIPSDNVSPNGAFLAIKGAPILMNIARQMQRYCPSAWLVNFANPVAVLSAMVNNHTPIKAMGVCAGYTNHQWDLSRILGKDEQGEGFDVETAGVNHLSFIVKGTANGADLFKTLNRRVAKDWKMPRLQSTWPAALRKSIPLGIKTLVRFFKDPGVLIFSTEPDGMMHLNYEQTLRRHLKTFRPMTRAQFRASLRVRAKARRDVDWHFQSFLNKEMDESFWSDGWREPGNDWAQRQDRDIFVEVLRGLGGGKKVKVVTSRPNGKAVRGFSDRTVLEYSQVIENGRLHAAGRYAVPEPVLTITQQLAEHQTRLGDALATENPRLLADALLSYPVRPYSSGARTLFKELASINRAEMPVALQAVGDYL